MATAYHRRITIPGVVAGMGGAKNPAGPFPGRRRIISAELDSAQRIAKSLGGGSCIVRCSVRKRFC